MNAIFRLTGLSSILAFVFFGTILFTEFGGGSLILGLVLTYWVPILIFYATTTLVGFHAAFSRSFHSKVYTWSARVLYSVASAALLLSVLEITLRELFPLELEFTFLAMMAALLPIGGSLLIQDEAKQFTEWSVFKKISVVASLALMFVIVSNFVRLGLSVPYVYVEILFIIGLGLLAVAYMRYQRVSGVTLLAMSPIRLVAYGGFLVLLLVNHLLSFGYLLGLEWFMYVFAVVSFWLLIHDLLRYQQPISEFLSVIPRIQSVLIVTAVVLVYHTILFSFLFDIGVFSYGPQMMVMMLFGGL